MRIPCRLANCRDAYHQTTPGIFLMHRRQAHLLDQRAEALLLTEAERVYLFLGIG